MVREGEKTEVGEKFSEREKSETVSMCERERSMINHISLPLPSPFPQSFLSRSRFNDD